MARKAPLITDQIAALEEENERLSGLKKLLDKAIRNELGVDTKTIHDLIDNRSKTENDSLSETSDFEQQIVSYFDLYLLSDKDAFIRVMCSEKSLNYYHMQLFSEQKLNDNNGSFSYDINDVLSDNSDNYSNEKKYDYSADSE